MLICVFCYGDGDDILAMMILAIHPSIQLLHLFIHLCISSIHLPIIPLFIHLPFHPSICASLQELEDKGPEVVAPLSEEGRLVEAGGTRDGGYQPAYQ